MVKRVAVNRITLPLDWREMPDFQNDLLDYWRNYGESITDFIRTAEGPGERHGDIDSMDLYNSIGVTLANADPFFISSDVCALVRVAANDLPELSEQPQYPAPIGLCFFESPLDVGVDSVGPVRIIAWIVLSDQSVALGVWNEIRESGEIYLGAFLKVPFKDPCRELSTVARELHYLKFKILTSLVLFMGQKITRAEHKSREEFPRFVRRRI